jgi:tetratricopeptide (TPR) repeat protein
MSRFNKSLLPVTLAVAAIVGPSTAARTQSQTNPSSTASPTRAPETGVVAPAKPQATPEQLGDAFMAHQRYQAAIEAYKKVPPLHNATVWNKMGIAYQLMFDMKDAMHCYKTSHRIDPRNANVLNNLGTVYDAMKDYHHAEKMYRKALKLDSQSALIRKNLGTNLLGQHKFKEGWLQYQAAVNIDPTIFENTSRPRVENPASISDRGAMNYYMAKGCVRAGMREQAVQYLRLAMDEGFTSPKKIIADNEFATLQGLPAFEELLSSEMQKRQ